MKKDSQRSNRARNTPHFLVRQSIYFSNKVFFSIFLATQMVTPMAAPVLIEAMDTVSKNETYGGVVVNQTVTMIGSEFYQLFTTLWNEKPNIESYVLLIRERPSARQGSQIRIDISHKIIFQSVLPINRSRVRELAEQAVETTYENVIGSAIQTMLFPEPDLGSDEI
jgi:curli production assembly/transport component CsgE